MLVEPDRVADLPHRGRIAPLPHRLPDDLQHLALPPGQHMIGIGLVRRLQGDRGPAALRLPSRAALRASRNRPGSGTFGVPRQSGRLGPHLITSWPRTGAATCPLEHVSETKSKLTPTSDILGYCQPGGRLRAAAAGYPDHHGHRTGVPAGRDPAAARPGLAPAGRRGRRRPGAGPGRTARRGRRMTGDLPAEPLTAGPEPAKPLPAEYRATPAGQPRARALGLPFARPSRPVERHHRRARRGGRLRHADRGRRTCAPGSPPSTPAAAAGTGDPVAAGFHSQNGNGEMTGVSWINESRHVHRPGRDHQHARGRRRARGHRRLDRPAPPGGGGRRGCSRWPPRPGTAT